MRYIVFDIIAALSIGYAAWLVLQKDANNLDYLFTVVLLSVALAMWTGKQYCKYKDKIDGV